MNDDLSLCFADSLVLASQNVPYLAGYPVRQRTLRGHLRKCTNKGSVHSFMKFYGYLLQRLVFFGQLQVDLVVISRSAMLACSVEAYVVDHSPAGSKGQSTVKEHACAELVIPRPDISHSLSFKVLASGLVLQTKVELVLESGFLDTFKELPSVILIAAP